MTCQAFVLCQTPPHDRSVLAYTECTTVQLCNCGTYFLLLSSLPNGMFAHRVFQEKLVCVKDPPEVGERSIPHEYYTGAGSTLCLPRIIHTLCSIWKPFNIECNGF